MTVPDEVPASVLPLLNAAREYECPLTVWVPAAQFAAAAWVAVQVGATPPLEAEHVHETEFPAEGNAGEAGEAVPTEQNASLPNEAAENPYDLFALPQAPLTGDGGAEEFTPSFRAPVNVAFVGDMSRISPAAAPVRVPAGVGKFPETAAFPDVGIPPT